MTVSVSAHAVGSADALDHQKSARQSLAASGTLMRLAQRVARNADFAQRGQLLVETGQLQLGPFAAVPIAAFGDWQTDPLRNRSWQWRLNWLSFVPYLIAHHAASGNERALSLAIQAVCSWLDHFGPPEQRHQFEFAWHDHATALRAEQIALLIHYVERHARWDLAGSDAAARRLVEGCLSHAALLFKETFFSKNTNHGLEQARVLLLLGSSLAVPDDATAAGWRECALRRIAGELRHAFTDEGVHVENSPAYHAFVFKVFLGIVAEYPSDSLGPLLRWMTDIGPKAVDFLAFVLRPDGLLPIIGDTQALPVTDSFHEAFGGRDSYQGYVYASSLGKKGRAPATLHRVYPESGYAIFRSEWPVAEHYPRALHAVVKAGSSSTYHRQQDDGHLVLWNEAEDWLIDSGLFNYHKASPIRQYMRSRAAHNVVVINRPPMETQGRDPRSSWKVLAHSDDAGLPYLAMRHDAYTGTELIRRVSLFRRKCLRVEDTAMSTDGATFDASVLWHVPADKRIELIGPGEVVVSSTKTRRVMRIRVQGDMPDNVELHRGVVGGKVLSVVSYIADMHEPSQVIVFSAVQRLRLYLQFEFTFEVH